ncbi:MAG: ABC transporter permease [Bacillota bacterium]
MDANLQRPITEEDDMPRSESYIRGALRKLIRKRAAQIGVAMLLLLSLTAASAQWLAPYDPTDMDVSRRLQPPSSQHLLGTDEFGRDLLSRLIHGSRITFQIGIISVGISMITGGIIGLIAGFFGGTVDMLVMRFIDIMMAFPSIVLALAIIAILGPSLNNVMIAVGLGSMPTYARLTRGTCLSVMENDYVQASRAVGATDARTALRHVLPNIISPIIILATLGLPGAILSAAGLSFIGLGAQPPSPEWGAILSSGRAYIRSAWWMTTFPGLAIMVVVLGFNLLGDELRDVLDPRLRQY